MSDAKRLAAALQETGRTQKDIAQEIGISTSYLNDIVRGRRKPSPRVAPALAHALGVPVADVTDDETLILREQVANLEAWNAELRQDNARLCRQWVEALGNPATPEELEKALVETPALRARVAELEAQWAAVPWDDLWTCIVAALQDEDAPAARAATTAAMWHYANAPKEADSGAQG